MNKFCSISRLACATLRSWGSMIRGKGTIHSKRTSEQDHLSYEEQSVQEFFALYIGRIIIYLIFGENKWVKSFFLCWYFIKFNSPYLPIWSQTEATDVTRVPTTMLKWDWDGHGSRIPNELWANAITGNLNKKEVLDDPEQDGDVDEQL